MTDVHELARLLLTATGSQYQYQRWPDGVRHNFAESAAAYLQQRLQATWDTAQSRGFSPDHELEPRVAHLVRRDGYGELVMVVPRSVDTDTGAVHISTYHFAGPLVGDPERMLATLRDIVGGPPGAAAPDTRSFLERAGMRIDGDGLPLSMTGPPAGVPGAGPSSGDGVPPASSGSGDGTGLLEDADAPAFPTGGSAYGNVARAVNAVGSGVNAYHTAVERGVGTTTATVDAAIAAVCAGLRWHPADVAANLLAASAPDAVRPLADTIVDHVPSRAVPALLTSFTDLVAALQADGPQAMTQWRDNMSHGQYGGAMLDAALLGAVIAKALHGEGGAGRDVDVALRAYDTMHEALLTEQPPATGGHTGAETANYTAADGSVHLVDTAGRDVPPASSGPGDLASQAYHSLGPKDVDDDHKDQHDTGLKHEIDDKAYSDLASQPYATVGRSDADRDIDDGN